MVFLPGEVVVDYALRLKKELDGQRLWDSLMELAKIGATPKGGVCRLTLTDLDKQGRDLVSRWARERARHVVSENLRVLEAADSGGCFSAERFGELMNDSHASLRDD